MNTDTPLASTSQRNLVPAIRASLQAKAERLLARPLIATIRRNDGSTTHAPSIFQILQRASSALDASRTTWREDPDDGTCSVAIAIDYQGAWRDREKEVLETIRNTLEAAVTLLTEEQRNLLLRSPREFLALRPPPESLELVEFTASPDGNRQRIVELKFAAMPQSPTNIRYVAIVPNLVPIERQLEALRTIEQAGNDGALGPLRSLVGLCGAAPLDRPAVDRSIQLLPGERLDEHQIECVSKATSTPHFSVIHGPPGSGKTTVISAVVRRTTAVGGRVLVVSPTHVAVDNVVEKLTADSQAALDSHRLPVRYAARKGKLSARAHEYWVGAKRQQRAATIGWTIEEGLRANVPIAPSLFAREDKDASGHAPLSAAVARFESVICGTPIGILSYEPVKAAAPAAFDLLIVDEVSKMTLPEFLAIAVRARRWVLVGDPVQLPPYNDSEENGATLDDVLDAETELVCTVGALLERTKPALRSQERLVVVASDPAKTREAILNHVSATAIADAPPVTLATESKGKGIVVCDPHGLELATQTMTGTGPPRVLVERRLRQDAPIPNAIEPKQRAPALIFENAFNVYHAQPWSDRAGQRLELLAYRNGIAKYLPIGTEELPRHLVIDQIAERFAVNAIAVYDWLTGIPSAGFDTSQLIELAACSSRELTEAVRPYIGALKKQYRMHPSISKVPRGLFYFGEALHDDADADTQGSRVQLLQITSANRTSTESNRAECEAIFKLLSELDGSDDAPRERPEIMVITPYREQEALLASALQDHRRRGALANLEIEVCTLDRCQGREAEYVFISLVRSRSSAFLDMPKRWNVALTRAMKGLFIVGDINAYVQEAAAERRDPRGAGPGKRPRMSVLARVLEAYQHGGVR